MKNEEIIEILKTQKLMSIGTKGENFPDNSVVCFAYDVNCNLYFGSYSDTLKCKNISKCSYVAITTGTLQIHGMASIMEYGTMNYSNARKIYDKRFPQYKEMFELKDNELYIVKPLVVWNYNPKNGQMIRDVKIFDEDYYKSIDVYNPHLYECRL